LIFLTPSDATQNLSSSYSTGILLSISAYPSIICYMAAIVKAPISLKIGNGYCY
jgi:hypothetical protein